MKRIGFLIALLVCISSDLFAQGAKNIKINEVMTGNDSSIVDEFGKREAWIELCNSSFTTVNVRGMYLTTDRSVLNKELSAPQRQALMSQIPSGYEFTVLTGHQHLLFHCNGNPKDGSRHITAKIAAGEPVWVALYDGNGIELIDSVSVPALAMNQSYAREKDGSDVWSIRAPENVTPGIANTPNVNNKIARTKAEDPHGFAITILAMGTVFACLALLFIFFRVLGLIMDHINTTKKIANAYPLKPVTSTITTTAKIGAEVLDTTGKLMKDGLKLKGIDKKVYIAVIAMAIKQYEDDVHDVESGIISIKPKNTTWNAPEFNNKVKK
ncbi:MAG: OadG family protein [Bacteroidales bacterium]|nr:OadG family protein [Bacteroidales bacterium]MCM1148110.1 OadG family protein [Bacteroidales bacterium]MCM1206526.1 OadG family protein [Bacillota bacterium]MCM1510572.1 OadG family protein [Clostridium sp.]